MKHIPQQQSEAENRSGRAVNAPNNNPGAAPKPGSTAAENSQLGAMPTFDVMPANSERPDWSQAVEWNPAGEVVIPPLLEVFRMVLPNGYTTDIQWFKCNVTDVFSGALGNWVGIPPDAYKISILLNGAPSIVGQNIPVYPLDGFHNCRIIGQGGDIVTINAAFPWAASYFGVKEITEVTGQMIVKNREQPQNTMLVQPGVKVTGN